MHPATLMSCPRIHRRNRRRQTRTAIRDDQRQVLAFQPAAIQILEQAFPVGLTLSLTAQKRQQVTPAIAPPAAETVANHGAESSSREYAQPAAGWCRSGSQNPARSSRCDRLAVGHAAVRTAPSPNSDRVAAPTAARKTAARLASSARINRPRNSLSSPPENVGNAH